MVSRPVSDFCAGSADILLEAFKRGSDTPQIPTPHDDAEYDAAVLTRLDDVHARVMPIIAAAATQLPRLTTYSAKLLATLDKINADETTRLTKPLIDSHHTV